MFAVPRATPCELSEPTLLQHIEQMFIGLTRSKALDLRVTLDPFLPRIVNGDAAKVRQVVINLVSNAVKFTRKGRVDVRASSQALAAGAHVRENLEALLELLDKVGFQTRGVGSGEEALQAHDAWQPDLILMDLRMPGIGAAQPQSPRRSSLNS